MSKTLTMQQSGDDDRINTCGEQDRTYASRATALQQGDPPQCILSRLSAQGSSMIEERRHENRVVSTFIMILFKILQEKNPRVRAVAKQVSLIKHADFSYVQSLNRCC
jgi:hypothetical protein